MKQVACLHGHKELEKGELLGKVVMVLTVVHSHFQSNIICKL